MILQERRSQKRTLLFCLIYTIVLVFVVSFKREKESLIRSSINVEKSIPEAAIVIMICKEPLSEHIDPEQFGIPYFIIRCSNQTGKYDGREAVPYLRFIIDHYDNPPAKRLIFIHGHRKSWHYTTDILTTIHNLLRTREFYEMEFGSVNHFFFQSVVPWRNEPELRDLFFYVFQGTPIMKFYNVDYLWFPCCASFFVKSSNIKIRTKQFYQDLIYRIRSSHIENPTNFSQFNCGRILEYTWHIIFLDKARVEDRDYTLIDTGVVWSKAPPFYKQRSKLDQI